MAIKVTRLVEKYNLVIYVILNYSIAWTFLYPAYKMILAAKGSFPPLALFGLIGGYAPFFPACNYIAAVLVHIRPAMDIKNGLLNIPLAFLVALPFGPLGEELGWRGYFLPQLLQRFNVITLHF